MADPLGIGEARQAFAIAVLGHDFIADDVSITVREDAPPGTAVIHCSWPLKARGPYSGKNSREITVQIEAAALDAFRAADPAQRGQMLERFSYTFAKRLLDGGYNEQDSSSPAFIIRVDPAALES